MKKFAKKTLCLLLTMSLVLTLLPVSASALDSRVEKAIDWAISIANDNSHGYSQTNRYGPNYDCSSLVATAFRKGGFNISDKLWTGNMEQAFKAVGFKAYSASSVTLQRGDILLRHDDVQQHTELCIGNNQYVGAHWDYDGQSGDSSGKEIDVYYDSAPSWHTRVLRYEGGSSSSAPTGEFSCNVEIKTTRGKRVGLYKNINDSREYDYFDQGQTAYSKNGYKKSDGSLWFQTQAYDQNQNIITVWLNAGSNGVTVNDLDSSTIHYDRWYYIASALNPDMVIDVNGRKTDNGTNIQIWKKIGGSNQLFKLVQSDDGYVSIISKASGKALDVAGGKTESGTNVQLWETNNTQAQKWKLYKAVYGGSNSITFMAPSGMCLDIYGGNPQNGTNISIYNCNGTAAQAFVLIPWWR